MCTLWGSGAETAMLAAALVAMLGKEVVRCRSAGRIGLMVECISSFDRVCYCQLYVWLLSCLAGVDCKWHCWRAVAGLPATGSSHTS